tara:strand:+ start:14 stop:811 length:798 start_codon:yes stop_codon:yes gene_type:complete
MANPLYGSNKFDTLAAQVVGGTDSPVGGTFRFEDVPVVSDHGGVDTATAVHMYDDGLKLFVQNIGTQTAGTKNAPIGHANGMDYSYDNTNNEGIQWALADPNAKGHWAGSKKQKYRVGEAAFEASLMFGIEDVSGADECGFGFRKVEAFQAAIDDYDEMAAFNIVSGDIKTETIINGATTVTTDLTSGGGDGAGNWANAAYHRLTVKVSAAGAVTYSIDGGSSPTGAVAYSFDAGEIITPFFYYLNDSDVAGTIILGEFSHGRTA